MNTNKTITYTIIISPTYNITHIDILFYVAKDYLIDYSYLYSIIIQIPPVKAEGAMLWKCSSIFTRAFILFDD